jgi:hypothetical protein
MLMGDCPQPAQLLVRARQAKSPALNRIAVDWAALSAGHCCVALGARAHCISFPYIALFLCISSHSPILPYFSPILLSSCVLISAGLNKVNFSSICPASAPMCAAGPATGCRALGTLNSLSNTHPTRPEKWHSTSLPISTARGRVGDLTLTKISDVAAQISRSYSQSKHSGAHTLSSKARGGSPSGPGVRRSSRTLHREQLPVQAVDRTVPDLLSPHAAK